MNNRTHEIITKKAHILQILLEQSIMEESIELRINNQSQIFTTFMVDLHPVKAGQNTPDNEPFSYLKEEQYLLLKPPVSTEGNAQFSKGEQIYILFFSGINAFEANVSYEQVIDTKGKQAIQVGFPRQLKVVRSRKYLRVNGIPNSKIKVIVAISKNPIEVPIIDMSTSGLSFCALQSCDLLSINKKIPLIISVLGKNSLSIDGIICHYTSNLRYCNKCNNKPTCDEKIGAQKAVCGTEFFSINHVQNKRIKELIFLIQREYLLNEKRDLINFNEKLERQVKEKTDKLREKDVELLEMDRITGIATLAAGIAHEINNPMGFIKSSIHYIKKGTDKIIRVAKYWDDKPVPEPLLKEYKDYCTQINFNDLTSSFNEKFDRIKKGTERIMQIVKTLKDFSRVDSAGFSEVDINQSIEDVLQIIKSQGHENVEFIKEFQEGVPSMESSATDINQCLLQTIQNATDAVENNGMIKIITSSIKNDIGVQVKIIDNGKGMSPEVLKQVFNPFFTTKPVGSGTGIGLSMIERIIKRHGGKIDISSKENLGTTVTMKFPLISGLVKELAILEGFDL